MNLKSAIANLKLLGWWFRQVSGDAAYENYLRSAARSRKGAACCAPDLHGTPGHAVPLMSREEFFLDSLRRRYSTISRCC